MNTRVRKNSRMESDHYLTEINRRSIPNRTKKNKPANIHRIDRDLLYKHRDEHTKNLTIESKWDNLNEAFKKNESRTFYREMKSGIKGYEAIEPFVKWREDGLKIGENDFCEEMARYFKDLLNTDVSKGRMTLYFTKNINCGRLCFRAEVVKEIKDPKANKAASDDGICAEEIKWGGLAIEDSIYKIITDI
ncbi:hypothetical protein PR048_014772 [Dryococelus australis]|uniref:Uncharacterized protein n=1 Tax=Dryococelus australis TaxID=614101 RepID=A0ABQ9HF42_9NEOP|nr:hypothetical protein PR048_014772 [Dryococelus australis]